jgi:UDP-glucuronate decarboxylase
MIRWIDETLGTAPFEDPATEGYVKLDVRGLVDGPANTGDALRERIETGLALLREHGTLLVCCDLGISRSNTVAAAIVARRDGIPFGEALALVRSRVGEHRMDYGIVETVRATLEPEPLPPLDAGRVLVTGGSGFVGQWLQRVAGDGLDLVSTSSRDVDVQYSPFELDAVVRRLRPSAIVHLANPRVFHSHEVVGQSLAMLRNVADVCQHHGVFLVYPSSWNVFSGRKGEGDLLLDDDAEPLPYGNYPLAKALGEQMVHYLRRAGRLQAAVLRMTTLYGPGSDNPRFLYRWAERCRAGVALSTHVYTNGRPRLQLLHVSDAARALAVATQRRIDGTFNIGGAEPLTTVEMARVMAGIFGVEAPVEEVPLGTAVAKVVLDTTKARAVLGWEPATTLREGFADLVGV